MNAVMTSSPDPASPLKPQPDCPECRGTGAVTLAEGRRQKCVCILKQEAQRYLTPTYADARYIKTLDTQPLMGKNILIPGDLSTLKSLVKSFLLNTAMKYQHETKSGYDVMQAYLNNSETAEFSNLCRVDFLVLYLVVDPFNRSYSNVLCSLLEKRAYYNIPTWVYSPTPVHTEKFRGLYGEEFAETIRLKFQALKV